MTSSSENFEIYSEPQLGVYGDAARTKLGRHFMATASVSVMSIMLSMTAQAQILPAGCTPSPATAGDTVICEGTIDSSVRTNVDDITIVIGDGTVPTTVTESFGDAVNVTTSEASGDISVTVMDGSTVTSDYNSPGSGPGGNSGIYVRNIGSGSTTVRATDSTGTHLLGYGGFGITTYGGTLTVNQSVTSTGTAIGDTGGISVRNYGTGSTTINAADSTGTNADGIYAFGASTTTDLTVVSTGTATGGTNGIRAVNDGTGSTTVVAVDSVGTTRDGIYVRNYGTDLSVSATGTVIGGNDGINIRNLGTGATTIGVNTVTGGNTGIRAFTSTGATTITLGSTSVVSGQRAQGILASSTGALADITVQGMSGDVIGGSDGINIVTSGANILLDNLDSVTGQNGDGIYATSIGGSITVNEVDTILGTGGNGILAVSSGGEISVQGSGLVGGIEGTSGAGIHANASGAPGIPGGSVNLGGVDALGDITGSQDGIYATTNGAGSITLDSTAGTVSGYTGGIDALIAYGNGSISVSSADVNSTGANATGISARILDASSSGDITLDSSVGSVTSGGRYGIEARNSGTGAISITSADVSATGAYSTGIRVFNNNTAGTGDLSIDSSAGVVSGVYYGIYAHNSSTGGLSVTSADLTGTVRQGIRASNANTASTGNLTIDTTAGAVSGGYSGIYAFQYGSGGLNITSADVTGTTRTGILARNLNASGTGNLNIDTSAGSVTGGNTGINAQNYGTGATTISAANTSGTNNFGIYASTGSAATDLTITSTGTATGGNSGIRAVNDGIGAISVTAFDTIGTSTYGIQASNGAAGTDLTVNSTGTASGGTDGISVNNSGSGTTLITAVDTMGDSRSGIDVSIQLMASDLIINSTGMASGGYYGIYVRNNGTGATTITAADSTGTASNGIFVYNENVSTDLTITSTGTAIGGVSGISAANSGTGTTAVTAVDTTGGIYGAGISASNGNTATDLTVTSTGTATGGSDGIYANNVGIGATTISAADTTGTSDDGISARNGTTATDLTVNSTGTAMGGNNGIYASNNGSGATTITTTNVAGAIGNGVSVFGSGTDLTVNSMAGTVTGGTTGIMAENAGTGATIINATDVTGMGVGFLNAAIDVSNQASATDISVSSSGNVMGEHNGIRANNSGTGSINIFANNVTGTNGAGIFAFTATTATGITIAVTGDVYAGAAGFAGINTQALGTGTTDITVNNVTGGRYGIFSISDDNATDLNITSTGDVIATGTGILALNFSNGSTTVNAHNVTATNYGGIFASNQNGIGSDVSVTTTGDVTGGSYGIAATNAGTSATDINANNATGTDAGGFGILANAGSNSTDLSINVSGEARGANYGIIVINNGTGATSITANTATGTDAANSYASGIFVRNADASSDMSITTTGVVSGGTHGIYARHRGTGNLSLDIGGDVTGGINGLVTLTRNGTNFTVAAGQTITGDSTGIATMSEGGSVTSNDTLNILGTVNGAIQMFEGDDSLTLGSGSNVNGALRGGDGFDTLNFNTTGGTINNSGAAADAIAEFEIYNFNGGDFILSGLNSGLSATNFNNGNNILFGTLESNSVLNAFGASLQVADGASITGDVTNAGRLGLNSTGAGTLSIIGDFTQTATGVTTLGRTGIDTSDLLAVSGDINLAGTLNLNQSVFFTDTITLIDGGTGLNGTFDTVSGLLTDGLLFTQAIDYDLAAFDVNLVTSVTDAKTIAALNPNQAAIANALTTDLTNNMSADGLNALTIRLGRLDNAADLAESLDELSVEIVDTGMQVFQNSQLMYMTSLLNHSGPQAAANCVVQTVSLSEADAFRLGRQSNGKQIWGSIQYASYDQDGGANNLDFQSDGYEINTGINGLRLGAASIGFTAGFAEYQTKSGIAGSAGQDQVKTQIFRVAAHGRLGLNEGGRGLNARLDGGLGFATGSNDIDQNVTAPSVLLNAHQTADPDVDSLSAIARVSVDGSNGNPWTIKPYVLAAVTSTKQDAFRLGNGVTAINVDKVSDNRQTLGYGARYDHEFSDAVSVQLDATAMHHFGGTRTDLVSSFEAAGPNATSFVVTGKEISTQYLVQGSLGYKLDSGLQAGIGGFAEFGDLEGYGGRVTIAKTF